MSRFDEKVTQTDYKVNAEVGFPNTFIPFKTDMSIKINY